MKTDISRNTFRPEAHFSRVLLQQGRVQLDADWNEQVAIFSHYLRALATDIIGPHGGPAGRLGFAIIWDLSQLWKAEAGRLPKEDVALLSKRSDLLIGQGRYYVDGLLLENESYTRYSQQPHIARLPMPAQGHSYLIYLDAWEHPATTLEDDSIREVALGGPDTAARARLVWQVKIAPLAPPQDNGEPGQWKDHAKFLAALTDIERQSTGRLQARTEPADPTDADPCVISPEARYRGVENQLYRVEIHRGGGVGEATFKWSRDNAVVVARWLAVNGDRLTISSRGPDGRLGFAANQWVELTTDRRELLGRPGRLFRIINVDGDVLTVGKGKSGAALKLPPLRKDSKARRWDSQGGVPIDVPSTNDGWIALEDGIEVKFEVNRHYRAGDYWLIPARTATGTIEGFGAPGKPRFESPHGVVHHYAPLAHLQWDNAEPILTDLRRTVRPLAVHLPQVPDALRIPEGHQLVLNARTKNGKLTYRCQAIAAGHGWVLQKAEAELFDTQGVKIGDFASAANVLSWTHSDASKADADMTPSSQVEAAASDAIPWALFKVKTNQGIGVLGMVSYVQQVYTEGGKAPADVCDPPHLNATREVPYKATYYFYAPE